MEREVWMERMTWTEIQAAMAEGYDTVLILTGSIEQHGPHLPLATDTLLGYAVGERIAHKMGKTLLAPVVRPGVSEHHMAFKGTVSLSKTTFKAILRDYAHSLARHDFKRIAFAWSHGGNVPALLEVVPQIAAELPDVEILLQADLIALFKDLIPFGQQEGIDMETLGIHAGELETSEMLAYVPEQVRTDKLVQGFMGDLIFTPGEHDKLLQEGLHKLTDNGVLGDARPADKSRGERYLDRFAQYVADNLELVKP
jgi:creatinine amidohydrolase